MRNNQKELNRNHSFGKLRRKYKKEINTESKEPEYKNMNYGEINNYNYNYNNDYKTIENSNPLHSKYNNIYTSYRNKTKNNNENDYNIEIGNNTKKKILSPNKVILPVIKRNKINKMKKEYKTVKDKIIIEKSEESGSVGENDSGGDKSREGSNEYLFNL